MRETLVYAIVALPTQTDVTPPRASSRLSDVKPPSAPKVFEVDREGETPADITRSKSASPYPSEALPPSFKSGDPVSTSLQTPEAIVVKRVKKKVSWLYKADV